MGRSGFSVEGLRLRVSSVVRKAGFREKSTL